MEPHEFKARATRQTDAQIKERLQWQAWCRVANAKLATIQYKARFEVIIGDSGSNLLHIGPVFVHGTPGARNLTFVDLVRSVPSIFHFDKKSFFTWLQSSEAHALYELELFAG